MQKEHNFALKQRKKLKKGISGKKTGSPGREALPGQGRRVCQIPEVSGTGTGSRGTPNHHNEIYLPINIPQLLQPTGLSYLSRNIVLPRPFKHSVQWLFNSVAVNEIEDSFPKFVAKTMNFGC